MIVSLWNLQASRQQREPGACQFSERLGKSKLESRGFESLRDLAVRRPHLLNRSPGIVIRKIRLIKNPLHTSFHLGPLFHIDLHHTRGTPCGGQCLVHHPVQISTKSAPHLQYIYIYIYTYIKCTISIRIHIICRAARSSLNQILRSRDFSRPYQG